MSATLIAVVLALLLGHAAQPLTALRRYEWFSGWARWLDAQLGDSALWRGRWGLLLTLGVVLALLGLFQLALAGRVYGLPGFVFAVAVLFYAWGPRDLDLDVEAVIEAPDVDSKRAAAAHLHPAGGTPSLEGPALVEAVFLGALRRWFGVLFWFLLLGPVGALGYRLVALAAEGETRQALPAAQSEGAQWLLALLNWPVAQLMTFALALVANFDTVFTAWRESHAGGARLDADFLAAAARASVDCELAEEDAYIIDAGGEARPAPPALLELRDAMSLVWRILLLWLAVLALFVLAGWVG